MGYITGREIIMAAKKASAWRTAVSLGADDGVLILGESFGAKAPTYLPDDSLGQADIKSMYKTNEAVTGASINGYLRYEGWEVLMALALGTAGTPELLDTGAYRHILSPADNINDLFATMAIKKSTESHGVWEIPSAKITGFTISARVGELASITVNCMGNKIETVSPVNTSLSSVTYPDAGNIVRMDSNFKVRMNSQSGAALSDSDKIYPYGFTLTYNRPFAENYGAGYNDMSEPVQDGFAESILELNFDKYNLDTFMDAIEGETNYKLDIFFEGANITGVFNYIMRIDIPKVTWLTGEANVGGPGTIPHNVSGRMLAVAAAPTGMSTTDPLMITLQNTRSADALA